jgi:hypothetical protein
MPAFHEAPHHVPAHPAKPYHAHLHRKTPHPQVSKLGALQTLPAATGPKCRIFYRQVYPAI